MRKAVTIGLGFLLAGGTVWAQQYLITRVAGGGVPYTPAPAASTALQPGWMATDAAGSVYFTDSNCVFKVDSSGVLTRVAGSSMLPGYSGDGGLATNAQLNIYFNDLAGLAVDAAGNVYIADSGNHAIRRVAAASGIITTVAGNGTAGYSGDGAPATSAQLEYPSGLAVDAAGNLYFTDGGIAPDDGGNNVIRKVTAATGIITTVAGNGTHGSLGDGGPATSAQLNQPVGLAVDASGNLYIADTFNNEVRKVTAATGVITTVAGNGTITYSGDGVPATSTGLFEPWDVVVDGSGNLYISAYIYNHSLSQPVIRKVAATGIITTPSEQVGYNTSNQTPLAVDGSGNLYMVAYGNDSSTILKVAEATGAVTTVAGNGGSVYSGDGGPATSAELTWGAPNVALDGSGNLYIADSTRVLKVAAATGIITTVAGNGAPNLDGSDSGDGGPATGALLYAVAVAVDGSGNLYIGGGDVVRKVTAATGIITTVAGMPGNAGFGYSGDGGPATSAQLNSVSDVIVDGSGNLYIADAGASVIRKVRAATGIITTAAGKGTSGYSGDGGPATNAVLNGPEGLVLDGSGNLYIADYYNNRIRKVAAATGIITTVAGGGSAFPGDGGPATSAELGFPVGVAVDGSGNLYINAGYMIRKVAAATGIITTLAGDGSIAYSGDGGPSTSAQLSNPQGLAVDGSGNIYFSDIYGVRMLVPEAAHALLAVTSAHSADFLRGQTDAPYSVVVSNTAGTGPTNGTVTVTESVSAGLTLVSMSGAGWNCSGATCARSDVLVPGASYPPITVTVNVALDAPSQATNQVIVSGGGSLGSGAADVTTIGGLPAPPVLVSPANGVTGVLVSPTLTWSNSGATSYDVYFGSLSTPPLVANTTGTSYAPPGTLSSGATYYWQIVARNDAGTAGSAIWSFTTGVPVTGSRFVPVTPCRVADTRNAAGPFGGPTMTAGAIRSFAIPQSGCNIPATAQAYALNVTAVPDGPLAYLTLWPAGQPQPLVSTLNSPGGIVVANAAIVPAASGGAVSVYVANQTNVILDINGYFASTGDANASSFYAATPCRVADTRNPIGQFGGPSVFAGQTRDFPISPFFSPCEIPVSASAYSLNVTVVPETDFLGYLTIWPAGSARPLVSTLNSWTGKVVANAAIVPVGTNESISVFVTDLTDVILDINGYFDQPGNTGALSFYPVTPCRIADTRNPDGPFGGPEMGEGETRSFAIPASGCYVPPTAAAYSVNVTVVPNGPLGYLTAWPTDSLQPMVSTLNSSDGSVVANAAIVPAGTNGAISIYVTNPTQVILDINGYFAP